MCLINLYNAIILIRVSPIEAYASERWWTVSSPTGGDCDPPFT